MPFFPYITHSKSFADVVSVLDVFTTYSSEPYYKNFVGDAVHLSDVFSFVLSRYEVEYVESFEDNVGLTDSFSLSLYEMSNIAFEEDAEGLLLKDVFSYKTTQRYVRAFDENISLIDGFGYHATERFETIFDIDVVHITDPWNYYPTYRYNESFEDSISINDAFGHVYKDNPEESLDDTLVLLGDNFNTYKSHAHFLSFDDSVYMTEGFISLVTLVVLGGTGSGAYIHGEIVPISVSLGNDEHFAAWVGDISNVLGVTAKLTDIVIGSVGSIGYRPTKITAVKDKVPRGFTLSGDVMSSAIVDLTMQQGSAFKRNVYYKDSNGDPIDLTGYTAAMQIRKSKASTDTEIDISTSQGDIIINGTLGFLEIHIGVTIMDSLDFDYGYYDLELYPEGDSRQAFRILEGRVKLIKQVTR